MARKGGWTWVGSRRHFLCLDGRGSHEDYRAAREEAKFDKLVRFADAPPAFREAMSGHMELEPMSPD